MHGDNTATGCHGYKTSNDNDVLDCSELSSNVYVTDNGEDNSDSSEAENVGDSSDAQSSGDSSDAENDEVESTAGTDSESDDNDGKVI